MLDQQRMRVPIHLRFPWDECLADIYPCQLPTSPRSGSGLLPPPEATRWERLHRFPSSALSSSATLPFKSDICGKFDEVGSADSNSEKKNRVVSSSFFLDFGAR